MTDFLRLIVEVATFIWPWRLVSTWEQGLYYIGGRYQFPVGPGIKFVIPFFTDVHCVSVVPRNEKTPLNTVTLRDGRTLTYQAALFFQVVDAARAYNTVDSWQETVVEIADGMLSELMVEADVGRKREELRRELCEVINERCLPHGVRMLDISFTQFVIGVRALRLLGGNLQLK